MSTCTGICFIFGKAKGKRVGCHSGRTWHGNYINIENSVIRLPPLRLVLPFWFVQMVVRFPSRERRELSGACFVAWGSSPTGDGPGRGHTTCATPMPFTA